MNLKLPMLQPPGFAISAENTDDTITLHFHGNADMTSIEPLDEYLRAVHEEALAHEVATVFVDFKALEFMNSSCFKAFDERLGNVQDLPPAKRYRVAFESNRDTHWQRRSLNALRCFAMDVVTVDQR